jgi:hypothetical protein
VIAFASGIVDLNVLVGMACGYAGTSIDAAGGEYGFDGAPGGPSEVIDMAAVYRISDRLPSGSRRGPALSLELEVLQCRTVVDSWPIACRAEVQPSSRRCC